jgi:hypothetical protein
MEIPDEAGFLGDGSMAPRRLLILLLFFVGLIVPERAASQIPGSSSSSAPASPQAAQADPLGRDNPRGCILGFIKAAQEENYSVAIQYFEPFKTRRHPSQSDEEELAVQLLAILNQKFATSLDFVSRDPQGR